MKIILRDATDKDTEFARKTHHAAYHDVIHKQFGSWDETIQDSFFCKDWENTGFKIISYDGQPCGYTRMEYLPDMIEAHELVLLPEFQNKGIGTFMLNKLIEDAKRMNVPARLQVFSQNRAVELYKRVGFKQVDANDTHIIMEWRG
jgi:GNAT superfamily N-acetyltransferase